IYRALSKDAKSRYASCAEFLADLERSRRSLPAPLPEGADATATLAPGAMRTIRQSAEARRAREEASRSAFRPSAAQLSMESPADWRAGSGCGGRCGVVCAS